MRLPLVLLLATASLPGPDLVRGLVNLTRVHRIAFALQYHLAQNGDLELPSSPHGRAVALQLLDDEMVDPWGTPYRIDVVGKDFAIIGAGSDRKFEPPSSSLRERKTTSLEADTVWNGGHLVQDNSAWLAAQVGKPTASTVGRDVTPLHRREPNRLPDSPGAALALERASAQPFHKADLDAVRVATARASMELLGARLEAYRKVHGTLHGLTGPWMFRNLRSDPWTFNDWLLDADPWGKPFRVETSDDGKSYTITSVGAKQVFRDGQFAKP